MHDESQVDHGEALHLPEGEPKKKSHRGPFPPGEANPQAKLTEAQVRVMRDRYAAGGITQQQLADEYGVNQGVVNGIVRGLRWRHVPLPPQ